VVTDHIDTFTPDGIRLKSGHTLPADIIITATGLQLQTFGGMEVRVDGVVQQVEQKKMYKAVMLEDLPNIAAIVGYTNLSWTMKADLSSAYVCRLINYLDKKGIDVATPIDRENCTMEESIFGSLRSGYVQRGKTKIMRQGSKAPWTVTHNYELDRPMLLDQPIADGVLQFTKAGEPIAKAPEQLARAA
jgi:monooxygenase